MGKGSRSRLTYERLAAMVSDAPASSSDSSSLKPLKRLQSFSYNFDVNKKTIKQFDSFEFIKSEERDGVKRLPSVTQPTVDLSLDYLFCRGENETAIGFSPSGQILAPSYNSRPDKDDVNVILFGSNSDQRYDIVKDSETFSGFDVLGFGNAYLQKYSYSASVGQMAKCSLSYLCSNATFDLYDPSSDEDKQTVNFPSVNDPNPNVMDEIFFSSDPLSGLRFQDSELKEVKEVSVIKPGEIKVSVKKNDPQGFSTLVLDGDHIAVQSANINLNFDRSDIQGLGNNYVFDRKLKYPVVGDLSVEFIVRDFNNETTLENIFSHDSDYTVTLDHTVRDPSTDSSVWRAVDVVKMKIDHAKLKSENFSSNVGDSTTVSTSFMFEVTPFTGMSLSIPPFDTDEDGTVNSQDNFPNDPSLS
jgi:hypothetical protein